MMKKRTSVSEIILPYKKINIFVISVVVLGIISGSIFLMSLSKSDQDIVINQIKGFFEMIGEGSISHKLALRNSLIINYLFVVGIWVLGFSMIGILVNIFLVYLKGFLVGFSISALFLTFGYKGIIGALLYSMLFQIFNIIVIVVLVIYSIMFSYQLLKVAFSRRGHYSIKLKKYFVVFVCAIFVSFISSLAEVYLFPFILKIFIGLYVG